MSEFNFISAKELATFINNEDLLMTISEKSAQLLIDYMNNHNYVLNVRNNMLYRIYARDGDYTEEVICIDDVIDLCCEMNYSEIQIYSNELNEGNKTRVIRKKLKSLRLEQRMLDDLYSKTVYARAARIVALG